MRVFQFHSFYRAYQDYFNAKYPEALTTTYHRRLRLLLNHRFLAPQILLPAFDGDPNFRFTVANDAVLQRQWAREKGLKTSNPKEILRAQIEDHRTEVLYSLDPNTYDSSFLHSLPGCVKATVCWLASPINSADFSAYHLRLCNFPVFLQKWQSQGLRSFWFSPSHDPAMSHYGGSKARPIDICFVGQYSRLHTTRNRLLEFLSQLSDRFLISFRLMCPKWKRLSYRRFLNRVFLPVPNLPKCLRAVSGPPVFGTEMYELFSQSKLVINAAIDLAENYRGNMRCFEALGCGCAMLSDEGVYPDGLTPGTHFATFKDPDDAISRTEALLGAPTELQRLATAGRTFVEEDFSKERQWLIFQKLVA